MSTTIHNFGSFYIFYPLECSILTQKLMAPFFEARYECFSIKCLMSRPSKEPNRLLSRLEISRNFCSTHFFQNVVTNSADSTFVDFKYFSVSSLLATSAWWGYPNTTPLVDVAKPGKWWGCTLTITFLKAFVRKDWAPMHTTHWGLKIASRKHSTKFSKNQNPAQISIFLIMQASAQFISKLQACAHFNSNLLF